MRNRRAQLAVLWGCVVLLSVALFAFLHDGPVAEHPPDAFVTGQGIVDESSHGDVQMGDDNAAATPDRAAAANPATGRLTLRGLWDGLPLADFRLSCKRRDDEGQLPVTMTTDSTATVELTIGPWTLLVLPPYALPNASVLVSSVHQVVWVDRGLHLTLEVVDPMQRPLPGAQVSIASLGRSCGPVQLTDAEGQVDVWIASSAASPELTVFEPRHAPQSISLAPHAAEPSPRLRVVLVPCAENWSLEVIDAMDRAIGGVTLTVRPTFTSTPRLHLGTTDESGRLEVHGMWMLQEHLLEVGGTAYPTRCDPPQAAANMPSGSRRLRVPRRASGTILLHGSQPGDLDWEFVEPVASPSGTGILLPSHHDRQRSDSVRATLPAHWPVRIQARSLGQLVVDEKHVVGDDGWSLVIEPRRPATRRVVLCSAGAPIQQVRLAGTHAQVLFDNGGSERGAANVRLDLPTDAHLTLVVTFADGGEAMLLGAPGRQEAAVTLATPSPADCRLQVRARDGSPLCDARVYLARIGGSRFEPCGAPGWQWALAQSAVRLDLDADGVASGKLLPGTYEVRLEHLTTRDNLGQNWMTEQRTVTVAAGRPLHMELRAARPRYARIRLRHAPGTSPPMAWILALGPYRRECRGTQVGVWLTEDAHDLAILALSGQELATLIVPPGAEAVDIEAIVHD